MDKPETLATLGAQDAERRQAKQNTQHKNLKGTDAPKTGGVNSRRASSCQFLWVFYFIIALSVFSNVHIITPAT
jgi:hypothetical protein